MTTIFLVSQFTGARVVVILLYKAWPWSPQHLTDPSSYSLPTISPIHPGKNTQTNYRKWTECHMCNIYPLRHIWLVSLQFKNNLKMWNYCQDIIPYFTTCFHPLLSLCFILLHYFLCSTHGGNLPIATNFTGTRQCWVTAGIVVFLL